MKSRFGPSEEHENDVLRGVSKWLLIVWSVVCVLGIGEGIWSSLIGSETYLEGMYKEISVAGTHIVHAAKEGSVLETSSLSTQGLEDHMDVLGEESLRFMGVLWAVIKSIVVWFFLWVVVAYPTSHVLMLHRRKVKPVGSDRSFVIEPASESGREAR